MCNSTGKNIIWPLAWVIYFMAISGWSFSQDYNLHHFTASDGWDQAYVYSIAQDELGYLWVGTGDGLVSYNGFSFADHTTVDSLADNFVTCSINDDGCMWFGHMNGGLSLYKEKQFHSLSTGIAASPVTCFARNEDGVIWMSTYNGDFLELNRDKGVLSRYSFIGQGAVAAFEWTGDKHMLIGTSAGLSYCELTASGEIRMVRMLDEIPEAKVVQILRMRSGRGFYIATENDGIYHLIPEGQQFLITRLPSGSAIDIASIQHIYEDRRGNLWICTFGNGLIRIDPADPAEKDVFNIARGFVTDNVKAVFEDSEGSIWCGNYGEGLTQITRKVFSMYRFDENKHGKSVNALSIRAPFLWICTEKGLLKQDLKTGRIIQTYGRANGLPDDRVTALYCAGGKDLWIGTENHGLFRMDTLLNRIREYPIGSGELENSVTCITGSTEGVWVGTKKGLCHIRRGKIPVQWFSISQGGLPHNSIHSLYIDRKGRLWISSRSNMLAYIQNEVVHKIPVFSGKGATSFGPFTEDADSFIWVGSMGNGIFRLASDTILNLTTKEGLLSDFCYSVIGDDNKHIWIGHKGGLSRITTSDYFVRTVQQIEQSPDLFVFNLNSIAKDEHGKIWLGSENGLMGYDPAIETWPVPPVPEITSIRINDEEVTIKGHIILKPAKYKIRIEFLAVSLKEPAQVTYRVNLEGKDHWSETTKTRNITYNLTDGNYRFVLDAISGDGVVSAHSATLDLVIRTPFWKRWWFYFAVLLFLALLIVGYIKRREYIFRAEREKLEIKVMERTHEIQSKNEEITSSLRYALEIQNAVLPSQALLDKLLPENFIFLKPKDIVSGDFYWLAKKNDKIIFTVADCTGHGVPGAFMSLLSITMLNDLVNIQGITRSDRIVNKLNDMIYYALHKSKTDGLDMALCIFDLKSNVIQFTGAMNHLVYIRDEKIELVKANPYSVNTVRDDFRPFTMQEIEVRKGDIFYLFSDGYMDQFGGERDKKYSIRRFYHTLLEIHNLPMTRQESILEERLMSWKNDRVQTDDITVMGIRF